MVSRQQWLNVVAVGCLAVCPVLAACSSGNSGTDGGVIQGADAGNNSPHDAGTGIDPHGLGMSCLAFSDGGSDCTSPGSCTFDNTDLAGTTTACITTGCTPNSTCGTTETGIANFCIGSSAASSECLRGCSPSASNPCERSDFACIQVSNTNFACLPSCSAVSCYDNSFGGPGTTCDSMGSCDLGAMCSTTTTSSCPNGQVCWTNPYYQTAECIADCRISGNTCSGLETCDAASGACDPVAPGGVCQNAFDCDANSTCVQWTATNGLCQTLCSANTDCTSPATCGTVVPGVCDPIACTTGGTACPTGESCQAVQGVTGMYCQPTN